MGLLDIFKPKKYDMDTVEGIEAIPVPAKDYDTDDFKTSCIFYLLQRKATVHKKAGRMDCAIACLKKSNELSDYEERPLLLEKEYLRLVKYIELTGDLDWAEREKQNIYARHPEFLDKRFSNIKRVKQALETSKRQGNDYVVVSTRKSCPICGKYDSEVYSISGKSEKYLKLPIEITRDGGFCPKCYLNLYQYYPEFSTPHS